MKDPYHVLGIARSASQDEIKKSYRRLAQRLHPDRNPEDPRAEEKFKDISAAHDLLSNARKRDMFDRGEISSNGPRKGRGHAGRSYRTKSKKPFESFFHRRSAREKSDIVVNGADVSYSLKIGFLEAVKGTRKRVTMTNGKCLDVSIPPGIKNEQILRLKSQGMEGVGGGKNGDATVKVLVEQHPVFTVDGSDVHMELAVTLTEAVLGGSIKAPTIDGEVSLSVPKNSNTGTVLRLNGKGLKKAGKKPGSQYIKLKVVLPDEPDRELTDFVKRWQAGNDYSVRNDKINAE